MGNPKSPEHKLAMKRGWLRKRLTEANVPWAESESVEDLQARVDALKAGESPTPQRGGSATDLALERQEAEIRELRLKVQALTDLRQLDKGGVPMELLDPDDQLETPVILFCNQIARTLAEKMVGGKIIPTPTGKPYKFETAYNLPIHGNDGKLVDLKFVSMLRVTSKRDLDWIAGNPVKGEAPHQDYGVFVFRSSDEANKTSTRDIEILQRNLAWLRQLSQNELYKVAHEYNISFQHGMSPEQLVLPLAKAMTERTASQERENLNIELDRRMKEAVLAAGA